MPDEYQKEYGENILDSLVELFKPIGNYKKTRFQFWKLVTDLFSNNFIKPIYDWCEQRKLKFTGHIMESSLIGQTTLAGSCMAQYEYFHIPGVDWLGRNIYEQCTNIFYRVSSVAHQLGKKQILCETFAMCGHNVGFDELKRIFEWQMVRGINLLCPHLQGYSLRGIRKRDYPPAMYYQQPWWNDYGKFIEPMARIGKLLAEGNVKFDTLVIHPQSTAWIYYDYDKNTDANELHSDFMELISTLEKKHVLFHLGDETIMSRHAKVEGNKLTIGTQSYSTIILPRHGILFDYTQNMIEEFKKNGGVVLSCTEIDSVLKNDIIDNENITYTKREFDDFVMHYFVNTTDDKQKAKFNCSANRLNIETGGQENFSGEYSFGKYESLVLIEKNGYVLNILNRALKLKREIQLKCVFDVNIEYIPKEICLVAETPQIFKISVNGCQIDKTDKGYFVDRAFRKIDIARYLTLGKNTIEFETILKHTDEIYENLEKAQVFESEKNKLTYDMEIEPIYLVGDFAVKTNNPSYQKLDRNAFRYSGTFTIAEPTKKVTLKNIERQGFIFFAGTLVVKKKIIADKTDYKIKFDKTGINVVKIKVNGKNEKTILWEPQEYDLSDVLVAGENEIEITIINNIRNLMGPHHLKEGESYAVKPDSFYKESCIWSSDAENFWDEDYCFAEMNLTDEK